ncbi:type III secretion protein [Cellvibrio sp. KY-GH-1]|uniref:flagellar biosynthetic protein FliR n=1 Tax=Cellvibrio sp. KY-GH-1 TaxID=2303332 RepID=UPI0012447F8E|nr:flagellar biosynthetic protein FliR [Cellvibrio sp. KY-GH-1]QEY18581.1 type III secretion protein [Cellvibrio sp. KY-GH-1]
MDIEIQTGWIISILLITLRLSILFFATPLDMFGRLPAHIKLFMCLGLAVVLSSGLPPIAYPDRLDLFFLALSFLNEALVGLAMAFGLYCAFGAMSLGGGLLDFQAGFGAANVLNPATNTYEPLLGTILTLLLVIVFFSSGAFSILLRGILFSFQQIPPGNPLNHLSLRDVVAQFGIMFIYGFALAAPVIAMLLLIDTAIGVMSRSMPQMNVYFLFLPLKIAVALVMVAISLRYLSPLMEQLFLTVFRYWERVL